MPCDSTAPVDGVDETEPAGAGTLIYDPASDQYHYMWKTDPTRAGQRRQLVPRFADGQTERAQFNVR